MNSPQQDEERRTFREEASSLWLITLGPALWAVHFTVVYAATAVVCAKLGTAYLPYLRLGIAALTLIAVGAIAVIAWRSWRQWNYMTNQEYSHGQPTGEHRHEFLGHAAFLLAVLAAIATLYTALPAVFIAGCG
ncbi:hypothetical protein [Pseudohoeflea coraliihabitans]|uniref:Transmembrane protein n=1 Tax=Pseudohoeflea coraliihabitans TaxID=2860393 RepID=A0ABS6WNS8_9HYPH|nr:hypothetical protein [Pseudohoeflea sp. DP4N28-3]MBW3097062.1 hypothetical protein [Pseudohoeflea sp. DP4N28-3]